MASTISNISILLFICFISQGYGQRCSFKDISITQSETGVKIMGKTEWIVYIYNKCTCDQVNVKLNCQGFQTVEKIDPKILNLLGDQCLLNFGKSIFENTVSFKYAWDKSFPFTPVSSNVRCT
ncbi:hypothetical protein Lal_00033708 [Lupinus albus]|uniref:Uncharacterized protein n=1 Tax=Lupinus albus TaxID=3870 RepID=A0A6A5LCC6_LUPAL|nr:hypothetical protein Lalb_Chr21g0316231 [Lupinus albus]KAF1860114.1 hypothetical protein Lal_00033708 [Lupinus albus]